MKRLLSLGLSALIAAPASAAVRAAAVVPKAPSGLGTAAAGVTLAAPGLSGFSQAPVLAPTLSLAPSVLPSVAPSAFSAPVSGNASAASAPAALPGAVSVSAHESRVAGAETSMNSRSAAPSARQATGVSPSARAANQAALAVPSAAGHQAGQAAGNNQSANHPRAAAAQTVTGMSASVAKIAGSLSGASAASSHSAGSRIDALLRGEKFFADGAVDGSPTPEDAAFNAAGEEGRPGVFEAKAADGPKTLSLAEAAVKVKEFAQSFRKEFNESVVGEQDLREALLLALLAEGNVLLEGLPGTGKTRSVMTVSQMTDLAFKRIQFQPDTAPSDITGQEELDRKTGAWTLRKGPIFTNILLADEINRATPKAQAALLEGMQEGRVTIAGVRHELPKPFFVLATQNPIDEEGTFPLPHAQLDRFMFKVDAPYSNEKEMIAMIEMLEKSTGIQSKRVSSKSGLRFAQRAARAVKVGEEMRAYVARVVAATRPETEGAPELVQKAVRVGASPRSAWLLTMAAKAHAIAAGRTAVIPEDVQSVAYWVLGHRLVLNFEAAADGVTAKKIIQSIFEPKQGVPVTRLKK